MDFDVKLAVPNVFIKINDKPRLISSMVLSTLMVCAVTHFVPSLMPLWMAWSTNSRV